MEIELRNQRQAVLDSVKLHLLAFPQIFELESNTNSLVYQPTHNNSSRYQNPTSFTSIEPPEPLNVEYGLRFQDHPFRKSNTALFLAVFGMFFAFSSYPLFTIILESMALTLAYLARRTERPNWRQRVTVSISFLFIIIAFFVVFSLGSDPNMATELA